MSELEKLVMALAIAVFIFILSDKCGQLIYGPNALITKQGYMIKVDDANRQITQQAGPPEVLDMAAIMSIANVTNGEVIFNKVCILCHTAIEGGLNKVGPNLWGVINGHAAHKNDFNYSDAMMDRHNAGVLWDDEELYRFLYAPKQYISGTKMSYAGIKDDKERADVISYLNILKK